jgi:hypothetical protein
MSSNYKFNIGCLIGTFLFAAVLLMSSCVSYTKYEAPCCEEEVCEEEVCEEELPPLSPFDLISEEE